MNQVPVGPVKLNSIKAGFHCPPCPFTVGLYQPGNFFCAECTGRLGLGVEWNGRRCNGRLRILSLAAGMAKLDGNLGALSMYCIGQSPVGFNMLIAPDPGILIGDPAIRMDSGHFYNNEPGTAHRAADVMNEMPIIWGSILLDYSVLAHRGHDYPIF
ncbi:hypothetical protein D3C75_977400 [compost metagenome]